jgi:hypothetical protein
MRYKRIKWLWVSIQILDERPMRKLGGSWAEAGAEAKRKSGSYKRSWSNSADGCD